jgi:NADH-quinone oxidoreductase subunit M
MLSLLLLIPLVGAAVVSALPDSQMQRAHVVAQFTTLAAFAYALVLVAGFDTVTPAIQYAESYTWNPRLGSRFSFGVDGLSILMLPLATLLSFVAVLASANHQAIRDGARLYYALVLVLESAALGVFVARDWSLFYVFWELTLIPLFFLIDRLGGQNRHRAALNFVLYTMGGSVFMLIALLLLYDATPAHSFDMALITEGARAIPAATQHWILVGLLIGFGVKLPVFPLHGWLPLAHVEAPSPVSILLSGVLLKMGAYGMLRAAETLPAAFAGVAGILAALGIVNLLYGGVLAWRQRDLKRMVAYSSISHMGVVLFGIATLKVAGITGAVAQMVAHGLVAGALFLLVGQLYGRTHTRDLGDYGNLSASHPRFAFFFVIAFLGAVGLPGTFGFIAEVHALIGAWKAWSWAAVPLLLSVLIGAAYGLRTLARFVTGAPAVPGSGFADLSRTETLAAALLSAGIVVFGFVPGPLLAIIEPSVRAMGSLFGGRP